MRSDRERLLDILEAVGRIEQRVSSDVDVFAEDEMQQVWVIHHLQIIGEAAYGLSPSFRERHQWQGLRPMSALAYPSSGLHVIMKQDNARGA